VEELMEQFKKENLSPKKVFQELKHIAVDFYPSCKIEAETIDKIIKFMIMNSKLEIEEIEDAKKEVDNEAMKKMLEGEFMKNNKN
jgi:hypothetical protein